MRLVAGSALIAHALQGLHAGMPVQSAALDTLEILAGTLLLVGLWTPVSGSLLAILGVWNAATQQGDPWSAILLATIGAGLALVGPGAWSADARLFGWRRINVPDRDS